MSSYYDYNAMVAQFRTQAAAGQTQKASACAILKELSMQCDLTPLLWMQYAAIAADDELEILKIGLSKFPGSALLQLRAAVVVAAANHNNNNEASMVIATTVQNAIQAVGQGSHRNEGQLFVVDLYRMLADRIASEEKTSENDNNDALKKCLDVFVQRSAVPMNNDVNANIVNELQEFLHAHYKLTADDDALIIKAAMAKIEDNRRQVARYFQQFVTYEDDIDVAMHAEGILARHQPEFNVVITDNNKIIASHIDWDKVLDCSRKNQTYGMGLGGLPTATAFVRYARALLRQVRLPPSSHDNDDDDDSSYKEVQERMQSLALAVYERGVAECPTVESLWLAYIRDLQVAFLQQQQQQYYYDVLQQVVHRAVRNCPYSVALLQQKLLAVFELAKVSKTVIDPDELLAMVDQQIATQFLPSNCHFDLYLTAIRVVKRRILFLMSRLLNSSDRSCSSSNTAKSLNVLAYDDIEDPPRKNQKKKKTDDSVAPSDNNNNNDDILQEIQDLVEDLSDMYDQVESRLTTKNNNNKNATTITTSRALLWKERAQTEALLMHPLQAVFTAAAAARHDHEPSFSATTTSFEKCIRLHNPPHPDVYALLIHHEIAIASTVPAATVQEVLSRIRRIRYYYDQAISAVGRTAATSNTTTTPYESSSSITLPLRDYESALTSLGNEWLDFERLLGSEKSLGKASKAVERKLKKAQRHDAGRHRRPPPPPAETATAPFTTDDSEAKVALSGKHQRDDEDNAKVEAVDNDMSPLPAAKKRKTVGTDTVEQENETDGTMEIQNDTTAKTSQSEDDDHHAKKRGAAAAAIVHKVRVGNIEYPAHAYTVRVSNLSLDTQDMDLVDLFRPKCGAIVHAKIMREKHPAPHHQGRGGQSKGWGLIQFEERESVEKALALNDIVGLHEKLVKIDRSHMPAASLVPPGMHRVGQYGQGKVSKRNEKRRQRKQSEDIGDSVTVAAQSLQEVPQTGGNGDKSVQSESCTTSTSKKLQDLSAGKADRQPSKSTSVLAFRPRGVARASRHPKQRLKLSDNGDDLAVDKSTTTNK